MLKKEIALFRQLYEVQDGVVLVHGPEDIGRLTENSLEACKTINLVSQTASGNEIRVQTAQRCRVGEVALTD
jgi:hypothetical protein